MTKQEDNEFAELAREGRGGDTEIGHLTQGEIVVPKAILKHFPALRTALFDAFREAGIDPERYVVGEDENSVNPETGAPEFFDERERDALGAIDAAGGNSHSTPGENAGWDRATNGQEGGDNGGGFGQTQDGGQLKLPAEYADFILEDGRRLEDVLGKGFFAGFRAGGKEGRERSAVRARMLAERRAQAARLNETRANLTGAQGVAGAAHTSASRLLAG